MDWQRSVETPQQPSRKRRGDVSTLSMRKSSTVALARLRESDRSSSRSSLLASSTSSFAPPSGNETCKPALAASTDKLTMGIASPPSEEDQQRSTSGIMMPPAETSKLRSRPQSQAWTPAEQRRLEQLLVDYPDEPVSTHRWAKIARALGTKSLLISILITRS